MAIKTSGLTLRNCTFTGNVAAMNGGAIYFEDNPGASRVLVGCVFNGNQAGSGGALCNVGDNPEFLNCTFSGNTAGAGGAIHNSNGGALRLTNCTLGANVATGGGGGVFNDASNPAVTNCILWGNRDSWGIDEYSQITSQSGSPTVTYSYIDGWWSGCVWNGPGTLGGDPLFERNPSDGGDGWGDDPDTPTIDEGANDDYGDLGLQAGSPCIDAGNNSAIDETTDLAGNPRKVDDPATDCPQPGASCGTAPIVDMGAYEK